MFHDSLAGSLVLLTVAMLRSGKQIRPFGALLVLVVGFLAAGVCYGSPLLLWQTFLLLTAEVVRYVPTRGPRLYRPAAVLATVSAWLLVGVIYVLPEYREFERIRERFPLVPIPSLNPPQVQEPSVPPTDPTGLTRFESEITGRDWNSWVLRSLHERNARIFANNPGFGERRIIRPSEAGFIRSHEHRPDLPQPDPAIREQLSADLTESPPGRKPDLAKLHNSTAISFVNPRWLGYIRDGMVAGFTPHGITHELEADAPWRIGTVHLVGLLLRPDPVVYVSDHLPRMEDLRGANAPTRPLDPFEADGLAALRKGDDLFAREASGRVRVLGSLRAAKQCVECHGGRRGDLLGALSYTLARGK